MNKHKIVNEIVDEKVNTYRYGNGARVYCGLCHSKGLPGGKWLEAHLIHVECECGAVVSKNGHKMHMINAKRAERDL